MSFQKTASFSIVRRPLDPSIDEWPRSTRPSKLEASTHLHLALVATYRSAASGIYENPPAPRPIYCTWVLTPFGQDGRIERLEPCMALCRSPTTGFRCAQDTVEGSLPPSEPFAGRRIQSSKLLVPLSWRKRSTRKRDGGRLGPRGVLSPITGVRSSHGTLTGHQRSVRRSSSRLKWASA